MSEQPWQARGINRLLFRKGENGGYYWTKRAELYYQFVALFYRGKND